MKKRFKKPWHELSSIKLRLVRLILEGDGEYHTIVVNNGEAPQECPNCMEGMSDPPMSEHIKNLGGKFRISFCPNCAHNEDWPKNLKKGWENSPSYLYPINIEGEILLQEALKAIERREKDG